MRQFAEMASIPNPYLSQIERGLREPSQRVVAAIARSFEMSADALYAEAGVVPPALPSPTYATLQSDPAVTSRSAARCSRSTTSSWRSRRGGRAVLVG